MQSVCACAHCIAAASVIHDSAPRPLFACASSGGPQQPNIIKNKNKFEPEHTSPCLRLFPPQHMQHERDMVVHTNPTTRQCQSAMSFTRPGITNLGF